MHSRSKRHSSGKQLMKSFLIQKRVENMFKVNSVIMNQTIERKENTNQQKKEHFLIAMIAKISICVVCLIGKQF